ncbi:efflux RND transporter permease subunit [Pseudomonas aeruginosa]|nr:efflux RND transporter permease subunit [Pseudomonas aeruginosa]
MVPLALSSGAGSGAQVAIGTGVLGGIVTATVLAVFLVPLFFLVVGRLFRLRKAAAHRQLAPDPHGASLMPLAKLAPHPGTVRRAARRLLADASPARAAPIVPANGPDLGASWTTGNSSSPTRCCDR